MQRFARRLWTLGALSCLSIGLCGCANSESGSAPSGTNAGSDGSPDPFSTDGAALPDTEDYVLDYEGPPLTAAFTDSGLETVIIGAPATATLELDRVESIGERAWVLVWKLEVPQGQETSGSTTLRATQSFDGPADRVEVRVGTWERDVQYFIEPEARLAAVVQR